MLALLIDDGQQPDDSVQAFRLALHQYLQQGPLPPDIAMAVERLGADVVAERTFACWLLSMLANDSSVMAQVHNYYPDLQPAPTSGDGDAARLQ